jgi:hypothetical protein
VLRIQNSQAATRGWHAWDSQNQRTRACHPPTPRLYVVLKAIVACHADPGPQGRNKDQLVLVRPRATAVQLARGFCSITRRRAWRHMPAFLWLVARRPPAFVPPARFPFRKRPRCPARTKGAGTRGRLLRWLTLVLVSEGRGTGDARANPAGRCHAMSRTGSARRNLFVAVPDPSIDLSIPRRGVGWPSPVRHLIRRRDVPAVVCVERWRPPDTDAGAHTVTARRRASFHGAGRRNCGRAVSELAPHAWRLLKCPIAGACRTIVVEPCDGGRE